MRSSGIQNDTNKISKVRPSNWTVQGWVFPGLSEYRLSGKLVFVSLLCSEMVISKNVFPSFSAFTEVLVEPKFVIPEGTPFTGGWCRPQNDGPGLRSITCMAYASKKPSLNDRVWSLVKPNLEPRSGNDKAHEMTGRMETITRCNVICVYIYIQSLYI